MTPVLSVDVIHCACVDRFETDRARSSAMVNEYRQDETYGQFETPGHAANLCACSVSESCEGEANNGGGARRAGRLDYLCDIHISQRRGGVQWSRLDQNGHILRAAMCVVRCQLDFMI